MQQDSERLDEEKQYNKYQQAYQYLIFNNPPLSNPMETYEYERILEKQFGIDDRTGDDITLPVISFDFRMKVIETKDFREILSKCWDMAQNGGDKFDGINNIIGLAEKCMM